MPSTASFIRCLPAAARNKRIKHEFAADPGGFELLDSAHIDGQQVVDLFAAYPDVDARFTRVSGPKGRTDFVRIDIPGTQGKSGGGSAPTLGIIGRLGGIGARPGRIGMVSDADGAIAAVASALKLAQMQSKGDRLDGDVIITTHICPDAPTRPHLPVDFMDSPIDDVTMNDNEVVAGVDAILSIDTTKGNRIINHKGFALSPTVKEGYILRVSEDLLRIMEMTSGRPAVTFPITTQDITPYGNGVYHLNSILQPSTATDVPVVGWRSLPSRWCRAAEPAPAMKWTLRQRRSLPLRWPRSLVVEPVTSTTPKSMRG